MQAGQPPLPAAAPQRRAAGRSHNGAAGRSSASARTPRGGGGGSTSSNNNRGRNQRRSGGRQKRPEESSSRDEDVLIAFMPYLKGNHDEAMRIHEEYQSGNDQRAFLREARAFLEREQQLRAAGSGNATSEAVNALHVAPPGMQVGRSEPIPPPPPPESSSLVSTSHYPPSTFPTINPPSDHPSSLPSPSAPLQSQSQQRTPPRPISQSINSNPNTPTSRVSSLGDGIGSLFLGNGDSIWSATTGTPIMESIWSSGDSLPESTIQILPRRDNGHHKSSSLQPPLEPAVETSPPTTSTTTTPSRPKKEAPQPKRLWTNFNDQPGRLFVNNVSGKDLGYILEFAPRAELVAKWSIPIAYIQERRNDMNPRDASLDEALNGLTIGLFRRGCTENGQQASIISKAITGYDYWHDPNSQCIQGKVPFFSPRTPGNVLFRMYWENNPLHTLAMGPTLRVRVTEHDFESSVRFILGNFRGKKSNPTSLSSLHSLATVLETTLSNRHESAARAVWGCLQESRKVIDICYDEYIKTSAKLSTLEIQVEALKEKVADEENKSHESGDDRSGDRESRKKSDAELSLYEKIRTLMSGRASCERKWRDSQLAFANILKAILSNASIHPLIRREQMVKLRLETELWCPLSEEFAIPSDTAGMWLECIYELPPVVTENHFKVYREAREKMQLRTLGSSLNMITLEDVVFPLSPETNQRAMNPKAIALFNQLSSSMGQYYQDLFKNEERVVRRRELIRARCQAIVRQAGLFPPETEVVIFGSSANGFGSPMSDMDMCLQLPHGAIIKDDDGKASEAMAKLVKHLEEGGMLDVDSSRLSARIPIIKFNSPNPLPDGTDDVIECDLSMQNPLAVLNTSLLRTYAEINPVTRVLAAVIKRWAKARDINCPERHTLSSYGYVIMLLHFLTFHHRTPSGLVAPIAPVEGSPRTQNGFHAPILPNLQWVDPPWVGMPKGTPYRELASIPEIIMKHPMKDKTTVNTYFYKPSSPPDKAALQLLFPGQDLSLSILLASFFRYYAYEFDFKRHVVSLHSTATNGIVEREVKAELDGWRNYSAALAIEDPFELEYDVAHVLRGGFYHRIRREFALAYSKIVEADSPDNLIDLLCEPLVADPDKDAAELQQGR